jgi:molybdopterin synthase sulfur carrier subunit
MRVLYFAWLREKIGLGEEVPALPRNVATPRQLMAWLRQRGGVYAAAFANEALIRCAVDQEFCSLDAPFGAANEIAFFPPVTGG